jgi:uncharacterized membrane protein
MPMSLLKLVGYYFLWHYTQAFADITRKYLNILWFVLNFFSIPELLRTFFSPFQRIREGYGGGFDPGEFLSILLVNTLMRIVGMVARSFLIVAGFCVLAAVFVGGLLFFAFWIFLPFVIAGLFVAGVKLLISPS